MNSVRAGHEDVEALNEALEAVRKYVENNAFEKVTMSDGYPSMFQMEAPKEAWAIIEAQLASLAAVVDRQQEALEQITLSPCYHDLDTPNERLLDEDEPCPACIAREALEKAVE